MKTIKRVLAICIFALMANSGFAQKNVLIHQAYGLDYKVNAQGVDSITFTDWRTPGSLVIDTYNDTTMSTNSHGKVTWNASYKGDNADIPGGFEDSEMDIYFDEANPGNIKFDGRADMSSTITFEDGREGPGHCVIGNAGVVWTGAYDDTTYHLVGGVPVDTIITTIYDPDSLDESTRWATLSAGVGDVVAYGDDYMATADFTYQGVTGTVEVLLQYMGTTSQSPSRNYHNFKATFAFQAGAASGDDWYTGGNIKSLVRVQINCVFQEDF